MALYYGVGRGPSLIPLSFSPTAAGEALPASRPLRRLIRPQRAPIIPRRKPGAAQGGGAGGGERAARAGAIDLVDEVKSGHAGSPGGGGRGRRAGGRGRPRAGRGGETRTKQHAQNPTTKPKLRAREAGGGGLRPRLLLGQLPQAGGPWRSGVRDGGAGPARKGSRWLSWDGCGVGGEKVTGPVRPVCLSLSKVAVAWARGSGSQPLPSSSVNLGSWVQ